ncbi:MAG: chromosome segregation protein SMC [Endomicrobiaceae bacterium]|nr:chromosome segregation protein SMC [Endomicrobiaceae bacterium]
MYLKKLELCGFKSFADKTVLTFEQGVSSIIGPNGCGKSNISDSIRWCLGEQRAKSMRSKNMQDVIFGGTRTRATTGMSEVTLTFDNSQNTIPIDYSEVAITRRLFRSGESEYFINKVQCRLKDIKDLFLDTGIGSGGYSIIEQNKVEELVMANPEIRREFFEEAAGVAKYKVRREETIHRLEKIEADMSRLDDSLKIYENQIKQLDIQAKKAKQYKKYQEDLAKYEIADIVNNLARGYEQLSILKKDLEPKIREFETSNTFLNQIEAEIEDLRLTQVENNDRYVSLNSELSDFKTSIALADSKIANLRQKDSELIAEQERLKIEIEDAQNKIVKYENDIATINTNDDGIEDEVARLKAEYLDKENKYNSIKEQISNLEKQEDEIRKKLETLDQDKDSLINSKTSIFQEQADANAEVGSIDRSIIRLQSEIEPSSQEIENYKQTLLQSQTLLVELEEKESSTKQVVLNVETEIDSLKEKSIEYSKKIAGLEGRISTLKEFDSHDPIRASIKSLMDSGYIKETVSSIISPDIDKIEIVANALAEKLDYLICATMQQAEEAIKFLHDNNLCKLTFIVLEKIPNDIQIQQSADNAIDLFKLLNCSSEYEKVGKFISSGIFINDDKVYGQAIIFGGGKNISDKPVLVEEQIKKMQQEIGYIQQDLEKINQEIDKQSDMKLNISFDNQKNSNEKIRINAQIENFNEVIAQKKADISDTVNEIEKLKKDKEIKQHIADGVNEKIANIDQQLIDIETESAILSENLNKVESDIDSFRIQEEPFHQEYMQLSASFERRKSDLEHRQQGQQYIVENITNLKVQIEQKTNRSAEIELQLQQVLTDQETEAINIQKYNEELTQKETEIQVIFSKKQEIQTNIDNKSSTIHETRIKVEALRDEVSSMEGDKKGFIAQKDLLETRIRETYGKTFDEIKEQYLGVEVNREEIDRIKKKMESLGQVNLAAQEEYDQLSQRYSFIQTQQQDLLKAKKDLEEVIKKINETTIENFRKTFDLVRENFKTLYKKLFGGGDADLLLTDENNLLESGVDIFAQPPGKVVKNILQCSGGEKALTAVALLFSFFLVKPSPFCILDEVDAPLDDANIGRYINVIKEFAQKTQFLVVTHNKRTMEMADILYGVTMEQQGVSKIISVRMNRESEKEIDQILVQNNA